MNSMSIVGGIINFDMDDNPVRHMDGKAPFGRKVFYLDKNGRDRERDEANKLFSSFQILEVAELYVYSSTSDVEFTVCPGKFFNSVMFGDLIFPEYTSPKTFAEINLAIKNNKDGSSYPDNAFESDVLNVLSSVYGFDAELSNRIYDSAYKEGYSVYLVDEELDKYLIALCAESMANYFKQEEENPFS